MNNTGLLLNIAIGDAYGASHEFNTQEFNRKYNDLQYHSRTGEVITDALYTDDTQMSIANTILLISGTPLTHVAFMSAYQYSYKHDVRAGYSHRVKALLELMGPLDALGRVQARNSNGCAMRVLPLCMISDIEEMKQAVIIQTTTTHPHIDCINATMVLALAGYHAFHYVKGKVSKFIESHISGMTYKEVMHEYCGNGQVQNNALSTVSFVLQNVLNQKTMTDALKNAIDTGGDTDSLAALSMGLWTLMDKPNNLPQELFDNLENGEFGRDFIVGLDQELISKYG